MPDNPTEFYANAVNVVANMYDVTLNFRAQSPVALQDGKATALQVSSEVAVRMSPQHAKALAALLVNHIKEYEKQFHVQLPVEESIMKMWNETIVSEKK